MPIEIALRKAGKKYRARFKVKYSRFHSPWFENPDDARLWEARTRVDIADQRQATGTKITVAGLAKIWLEKHSFVNKELCAAKRDEQFLRIHFLPKLGRLKLRDLTLRDISFHFADLQAEKRLGPKTINNGLGVIKKMLGDAAAWGYVSHSPATHAKRIKMSQQEVTIFNHAEIAALLEFAKSRRPREYEILVFAFNTGCRMGECLGLAWDKIDMVNGFATIDTIWDRETKSFVRRTKGKRFRKIPLNTECISLLKAMTLLRSSAENGRVFGAAFKDGHSHRVMKIMLKGAGLQAAETRGVTFHSTRHTFASEFMRRGGSLYQLQQILGHSTITQTEKYAHFAPEYLAGTTEIVSFASRNARVIPIRVPEKVPQMNFL